MHIDYRSVCTVLTRWLLFKHIYGWFYSKHKWKLTTT